jgi:hypothetical protein
VWLALRERRVSLVLRGRLVWLVRMVWRVLRGLLGWLVVLALKEPWVLRGRLAPRVCGVLLVTLVRRVRLGRRA